MLPLSAVGRMVFSVPRILPLHLFGRAELLLNRFRIGER